jgi:transcriptional regulator with XRE-family HTH domain
MILFRYKMSDANEILVDIGEEFRKARQGAGLTQDAVARSAGMVRPRYVELEKGRLDVRLTTLVNAARAVGLELMLVQTAYVPAVKSMLNHSTHDADDTPLYRTDEEEEANDVAPRF